MGEQAYAAGGGEQAEGGVQWKAVVGDQGGQGAVDVGLQAGEGGDFVDEAGDDFGRLEQGEQRGGSGVAVGVEVVAKTGQGQPGGQVMGQYLVFVKASWVLNLLLFL